VNRATRAVVVLGILMVSLAMFAQPSGASAPLVPCVGVSCPHATDGTHRDNVNGPDFGPPPLAPMWQDQHLCEVMLVDPPSFVYITIHFSWGEVAVVPYHSEPPNMLAVLVHDIVDGHKGSADLTWNIGLGHSASFSFDCTHPTTTTTTVPQSTTSTTIQATTTTVTASTTTPTTTVIGTPKLAAAPPTKGPDLPMTGGPELVLGVLGLAMVGAGTAMLIRSNQRRSYQN
jgi:hypothetical protein